jgi:hypothetical protein
VTPHWKRLERFIEPSSRIERLFLKVCCLTQFNSLNSSVFMAVKTLYSQFDDKKAAPYVFCDSLNKLVTVLNVE